MGMGFDNSCKVSEKWNVSRVIPRLYGWVYKTLRLSQLVVQHSVVVWVRDGIILAANYRFPFYEIWVQNQWDIKFWDTVEDSDTSGPSSSNISTEYLFAFQYWYCEPCVENRWGGGRKHCFVKLYSLLVVDSVRMNYLFRASWNRIFFQPGF